MIENTLFTNIKPSKATLASIIYKEDYKSILIISSSKFICNYQNVVTEKILSYIEANNVKNVFSSPLYLSGGEVNISMSVFSECYGALNGGVIFA